MSPSEPTSPATSTPSVRSASERVILLAALKDAVGKAYEAGRQEAIAEMERAGSVAQRVKSTDAEPVELGRLTTSEGKWVAEVDEDELLAWVFDHRPSEYYRPVPPILIRDSFRAWCEQDALANAKRGKPYAVDPETGEPIPGVRAAWKPGGTTVTANATAKGRAAGILANLFTEARGLPASNGETDESAQIDEGGPGRPGDERPGAHGVLERLGRAHGWPDRDGAGRSTDPGPGEPGDLVPGASGRRDDGPVRPGEGVAGGLLGHLAGLPHPDADLQPEPEHYAHHEPASVAHADRDFAEPAPF